jgi:hypothetical protein
VKLSDWIQILLRVGVSLVAFGILVALNWQQLFRIAKEHFPLVIVGCGLVCVVFASFAWLVDSAAKDKVQWPGIATHEEDSKTFYIKAQDRLSAYMGKDSEVTQLSLELDAKMKLEDFLIKFREADHAQIKVWGTIFVSGVVSLIVALLAFLAKAYFHL